MCSRRIINTQIMFEAENIMLMVKYHINPYPEICNYILDKKLISSYMIISQENILHKFKTQQEAQDTEKNLKNLTYCQQCSDPKACLQKSKQ